MENQKMMKCPECSSTHINKNGIKRGKQNYLCVDCGRQFINPQHFNSRGYSDQIRSECLKMYVNGMGFRAIEKVKGVHHTTVINWVKDVGRLLPNSYQPLWEQVKQWNCYFYVTDGWKVYPNFIPEGDQIMSKTYMTRVEGENTRLRHYLARLHRKTLCYSKSVEMLKYSISLLIHSLKFQDVPIPYRLNERSRRDLLRSTHLSLIIP